MNLIFRSIFLLPFLFFLSFKTSLAAESKAISEYGYISFKSDSVQIKNRLAIIERLTNKKIFSNLDDKRKKKVTAALLTVFLGPLGVHRLYLGCSPIVPAVYVFTLGGCLGILPLIDLMVIIFSDDLSPYENNNKIFMWVK